VIDSGMVLAVSVIGKIAGGTRITAALFVLTGGPRLAADNGLQPGQVCR
jgi:hypothetical protein